MIALLGMYDRAEVAAANDMLWALIRDNLRYGPQTLSRDLDFWQAWRSSELLLAQTCGLPYRAKLHECVQLVGTPDYGLSECPPGYYRSVIVARKASGVQLTDLPSLRFAFNERLSQSGWAAFWAHIPNDISPRDMIQSGAHARSARMVANSLADIACLDALSWQMMQRYDDFTSDLEVIGETDPTPGLPYITAMGRDADQIGKAVRRAITQLDPADKDALQLRDLVQIPAKDYLSLPLPPA